MKQMLIGTSHASVDIKKSKEQRGKCIKRLFFAPLYGQKIKVALHKFLLISLLEQ